MGAPDEHLNYRSVINLRKVRELLVLYQLNIDLYQIMRNAIDNREVIKSRSKQIEKFRFLRIT